MPQGDEGFASLSDLLQARSRDAEISFCPATAFGSGISEAGGNHALLLKPFQGSIHASDRGLASGGFFDGSGDGNSVGILANAQQSQQYDQFKLSELGASSHIFNYKEEIACLQSQLQLLGLRRPAVVNLLGSNGLV